MGFLEKKIVKSNTIDGEREIIDLNDSVCFGIITKDDYILCANQFRASTGKVDLSTYGGYIDDGETIESALYRELWEESNLDRGDVESIEYIYKNKIPSMGICNEKNSLAIVRLNKIKKEIEDKIQSNDEQEHIKGTFVHCHELEELPEPLGLKTFIFMDYIIGDWKYRLPFQYEHTDGEIIALKDGYLKIRTAHRYTCICDIFKNEKFITSVENVRNRKLDYIMTHELISSGSLLNLL